MTRLAFVALVAVCAAWALAVFVGVELRACAGRLVNRMASAMLPHWSRI